MVIRFSACDDVDRKEGIGFVRVGTGGEKTEVFSRNRNRARDRSRSIAVGVWGTRRPPVRPSFTCLPGARPRGSQERVTLCAN